MPPTADEGVLNATFCATLVDEWVRSGVTDAVVAPGSRSTPLALALAARPELAVQVHHDERAAGFVALGLGMATGRPAVVLTTSGTAAVELHPAVVEAHQAGVPLVVATADRPPELHDVGAPQTVDQTHLFGRAVRWFAEPGPPAPAAASTWRSLASRSVVEAVDGVGGPGPVHLNLAFREPLLGRAAPLPAGRGEGEPWHVGGGTRTTVDRRGLEGLTAVLDGARGVIVAGAGCGPVDDVVALADAAGWPILADARSGCRSAGRPAILHADALLRCERFAEDVVPEVVLRLGAPPASKVLAGWLAASGARQVAVDADGRWFDPDRTATHVVRADPGSVLRALARSFDGGWVGDWGGRWAAAEASASAAVDAVLAGHDEPTEPGVARTLCRSLPGHASLVVSSSMPIRDVEWFGGPTAVRVLANRGANGIDGVVSTAVGVALAARWAGGPTVALVGDVAFLHDSNALLGLAARGVDLTIVVVDNDGGGIFSFLPQAEALDTERFEQLFGTPHGVDPLAVAAAHGIDGTTVTAAPELAGVLRGALDRGGVHVVRVVTDRAANVAVHREIHDAVAAALASSHPGSDPNRAGDGV
ncbi:MAG: 2-succinyl-5-enolpyruvyl-6-hydroxy-3-cyclohexene-1-carboxylic-acid synthase [Actinobacteria bacterium]|nr:2-succinyl-5-enolpyruvyl-6-hydroxy-3-cyclohexene-1-carboxylic-acid synthase [Actinomycetota bacterium]